MENIFNLVVIALLVEVTTQVIKEILDNFKLLDTYKNAIVQGISLIIGILITYFTEISIFFVLGIQINFYVGWIITGILVSKGSNFIFDIFKKLKNTKEMIEELENEKDIKK